MSDQQGNPCPKHPGKGMRCFCDEERDRLAGIHRAGSEGNAFGGYNCICGNVWLDSAGGWCFKISDQGNEDE